MLEEARRDAILTVSNRGPVEHRLSANGCLEALPGQGGLATALRVTANLAPTVWLSSPLTPVDRLIAEGSLKLPASGCRSHYISTDPGAYKLFYKQFCNEV